MIKYWLFELFFERKFADKELFAKEVTAMFDIAVNECNKYFEEFSAKKEKEQLTFYVECLKKDIFYHENCPRKMSSFSVISVLKSKLEQANKALNDESKELIRK